MADPIDGSRAWISYDHAVNRMIRFRTLQRYSLLTLVLIPGLLLFDVVPVRVVSLWLFGWLAFATSGIAKVHFRNMAAELSSRSEHPCPYPPTNSSNTT